MALSELGRFALWNRVEVRLRRDLNEIAPFGTHVLPGVPGSSLTCLSSRLHPQFQPPSKSHVLNSSATPPLRTRNLRRHPNASQIAPNARPTPVSGQPGSLRSALSPRIVLLASRSTHPLIRRRRSSYPGFPCCFEAHYQFRIPSMYATALAVFQSGGTMFISGNGTCNNYSGREDVGYLNIP